MRATDLFALAGIDVVVCALLLGFLYKVSASKGPADLRLVGCTAVVFICLWIPLGDAGGARLPLLGYLRGFSSDISVTSLVLACLAVGRRLRGTERIVKREYSVLFGAVAMASLVLYPTALGWGNWDAYRLGWNSPLLGTLLVVVALAGALAGVRLLPLMIAAAVFAWATGLMESGNLWDYLMDPWLAVLALFHTVKAAWGASQVGREGRVQTLREQPPLGGVP